MAQWLTRFDVRQAVRPILVFLLVWLGAALAFHLFAVRPRINAFEQTRDSNEPRLNALKQQKEKVENREAFLEAVRTTEQNLATLRKDILSLRERRLIEVQSELHGLADRFRISMDRVQYDDSELEDEELLRFAMVFPLEGNYTNLREFIQAAEESDKFLVIESVGIGQAQQGGNRLQLNITVASYFDAPQIRARKERDRRTGSPRRS